MQDSSEITDIRREVNTMAKNILSLQKMQTQAIRGCVVSFFSWSFARARSK